MYISQTVIFFNVSVINKLYTSHCTERKRDSHDTNQSITTFVFLIYLYHKSVIMRTYELQDMIYCQHLTVIEN